MGEQFSVHTPVVTPVCAVPKSSVQSQYFCPEPTKGRRSHIFCAFAFQILHTVFPQKNPRRRGAAGGFSWWSCREAAPSATRAVRFTAAA